MQERSRDITEHEQEKNQKHESSKDDEETAGRLAIALSAQFALFLLLHFPNPAVDISFRASQSVAIATHDLFLDFDRFQLLVVLRFGFWFGQCPISAIENTALFLGG